MQALTRAKHADIDELHDLIQTAHTPRERAARQFVIDAFRHKMPRLIPFAFENESLLKLASYLLNYTTGSPATLFQYVFGVHRFCQWIDKRPDDMIRDIILDKTTIDAYLQHIDAFVGDLRAEHLAPGTINNHVKGVKALFRTNGIPLILPYRLPKRVTYPDRAPTPEELSKLVNVAALRDKVVLCFIALGGFRVGTLTKLQYRHVKTDLEAGRLPVHVHVEAEITKGKYHAYDTFLGQEAIDYLTAYLDARTTGNERRESGHIRGMPPEAIHDASPIIRNEHSTTVKPVTPAQIHRTIHGHLLQTGIVAKGNRHTRRYPMRVHSIRKYFRTQLGAISTMPTDYIDYMMGHTVSTYNDIRMKGIEFLRTLYASSGLSIRPKTRISKIERLTMFAESLGLNPNEVLSRDAVAMPHRTLIDPNERTIAVLNQALKEAILKELQQ